MSEAVAFHPETRKPQVCAQQCSTCVFRPGNPMSLRPGRLKTLIQENTGDGKAGLLCHETLSYGQHPEIGPSFCRGFFDTFGHMANGIRVFARLGGFTEVEVPEEADGRQPAAAD